jgi:hypothetical protein
MVPAFDENARRETASQNSPMDPPGRRGGGTLAVMAGHHRGNGEKRDGGRRSKGPDNLEKRIGKAADRRINPHTI